MSKDELLLKKKQEREERKNLLYAPVEEILSATDEETTSYNNNESTESTGPVQLSNESIESKGPVALYQPEDNTYVQEIMDSDKILNQLTTKSKVGLKINDFMEILTKKEDRQNDVPYRGWLPTNVVDRLEEVQHKLSRISRIKNKQIKASKTTVLMLLVAEGLSKIERRTQEELEKTLRGE